MSVARMSHVDWCQLLADLDKQVTRGLKEAVYAHVAGTLQTWAWTKKVEYAEDNTTLTVSDGVASFSVDVAQLLDRIVRQLATDNTDNTGDTPADEIAF